MTPSHQRRFMLVVAVAQGVEAKGGALAIQNHLNPVAGSEISLGHPRGRELGCSLDKSWPSSQYNRPFSGLSSISHHL